MIATLFVLIGIIIALIVVSILFYRQNNKSKKIAEMLTRENDELRSYLWQNEVMFEVRYSVDTYAIKCDHLLGRKFDGEVYILASDVMEVVEELEQKLQDHCIHCPVKEQEDDVVADLQDTNKVLAHNGVRLNKMLDEKDNEITELKAENESLKYSVATLETDIAMMKRWRKMSEELPKEEDEYYLVFDKYGYMDTDRWRKDKSGVWGFSVHGESVRYFMPLPSAPKEAK